MKLFIPHPVLQPYIRHYHYSEIGEKGAWSGQGLPASTGSALAIVTGREKVCLKEEGVLKTYEPLAVVGQITRFKEVIITGRVSSLWVIFRPCGMPALLGPYLNGYPDSCINLTDLAGSGARPFVEKMMVQSDPEKTVHQLELFLLDQYASFQKQRETYLQLRSALEQLKEQCTQKNIISRICQQNGYSIRSFERNTLQITGACPKRFQRIARFNLALRSILNNTMSNWAQLACEFGYTDQSHFIKDFKLFYGKTPGAISPDDGVMKHVYHPKAVAV